MFLYSDKLFIVKLLGRILLLSTLVLSEACNPYPYVTWKFDNLNEGRYDKDSVYMIDPIVETRRQITKDYFEADLEAMSPAATYSREALHKILGGRLAVKFGDPAPDDQRIKKVIDSILIQFTASKYSRFLLGRKLPVSTSADLILIPYLIWTRTTPEFESEKCGPHGRIYTPNEICYWTRAQAYLFLIDNRMGKLVYYRFDQWYIRNLRLPFEKGIAYSFRNCSRGLLQKMRHRR